MQGIYSPLASVGASSAISMSDPSPGRRCSSFREVWLLSSSSLHSSFPKPLEYVLLILFQLVLLLTYESLIQWLIKNGFNREGLQTLADLQGDGDPTSPRIVESYEKIKLIVQAECTAKQATWTDLFTKFWRQTLVAVTGQLFAQLNGINAVLFFLPIILVRAGKTVEDALKFAFIAAICYCAGTVPAIWAVEWSRKKWLLITTIALIVALSVIGSAQLVSEDLPRGNEKIVYSNVIFTFFCVCEFVRDTLA